MRNSKAIKLKKGLSCTVLELTIADIVSFLSALGDTLYTDETIKDYLTNNPADMLERAKKMIFFNQDNFEELIKKYHSEILTLFFEVNESYFDSKRINPKRKLKYQPKKANFLAKNLRDSAEVLIREGHANIANYGWMFFQRSVAFQEKLIKESKK